MGHTNRRLEGNEKKGMDHPPIPLTTPGTTRRKAMKSAPRIALFSASACVLWMGQASMPARLGASRSTGSRAHANCHSQHRPASRFLGPRWRRHLRGHPICAAAGGQLALEGAAAGESLDRRPRCRGFRAGVRSGRASEREGQRRLPAVEHLGAGVADEIARAGHALVPRRRECRRIGHWAHLRWGELRPPGSGPG